MDEMDEMDGGQVKTLSVSTNCLGRARSKAPLPVDKHRPWDEVTGGVFSCTGCFSVDRMVATI
jgi:hypothetical protein